MVRILFPGQSNLTNSFSYEYLCNQTVMENGTLVKVDCNPDYRFLDTFYVPRRPEETPFECVTNRTDTVSLSNDHWIGIYMYLKYGIFK